MISKVGFIDTSNIIYETTGSTEWVATEDCFLVTQLYSNGDSSSIKIDDVVVAEFANPITKCSIAYTSNFPIKKGQKVTLSLASTKAPVFFYKMI